MKGSVSFETQSLRKTGSATEHHTRNEAACSAAVLQLQRELSRNPNTLEMRVQKTMFVNGTVELAVTYRKNRAAGCRKVRSERPVMSCFTLRALSQMRLIVCPCFAASGWFDIHGFQRRSSQYVRSRFVSSFRHQRFGQSMQFQVTTQP